MIINKIIIVTLLSFFSVIRVITMPQQSFEENLERYENQNKTLKLLNKEILYFLDGYSKLTTEHFDAILNKLSHDDIQELSNNKELQTQTRSNLVPSMITSIFSVEIIDLLTQPLINSNLILICKRMVQLGYSLDTINRFKKYLLSIFSGHYKDIADFEKAIVRAAHVNNNDCTEILSFLQNGYRPDWVLSGNLSTGLMLAIKYNLPTLAKIFLDQPHITLDATDFEGTNALMMSISCKQANIVKKLLKNDRWNIYQQNKYGKSPLSLAEKFMPSIVNDLLIHRNDNIFD